MKKNYYLCVVLLLTNLLVQALYPIGHRSVTYTDPARSNRSVSTEIYYPATTAGESTTVATGQFPLIVFGHGFVMAYSAYAYFKDAMVPLGYIVVFATTETGISPVHADFGADLAFLINQLKAEGANSSSPFYNTVATTSAIFGHSMGGGSSFLACANNIVPTCMVTMAAANTTPSSITAAQQVTIPALVLSGEVDCVADPATNQLPMYDSLASECKVFISIKGGCHCYFADYNLNCTFGEQTCDVYPPLARADQEDATLDYVKLYLDYYLKGNVTSWTVFNDSLAASPRITYQESCISTEIKKNNIAAAISVWPNPVSDVIYVEINAIGDYKLNVVDILGKKIISGPTVKSTFMHTETINISGLQNGLYFVEVELNGLKVYKKFIKN